MGFSSRAQFYSGSNLQFGKNRVQYNKERFWSHYRYSRFDTYFYKGGKELAIYTAQVADKEIAKMEEKLDYYISGKMQFIVFNTLNDLKSSNIGLITNENFNVGGITHISGNKIILYFDGSHKNLELQIRNGIAQILTNQMLYGEQITANVKNAALINLPEWFVPGLVSYLAEDWNTTIDNQIKDGILSGRYGKISLLNAEEAVAVGHSIWRFIDKTYGKEAIPNIIYMTKISRGYSNGFLFVLGTSYDNLIDAWLYYYKSTYLEEEPLFQSFDSEEPISGKTKLKNNRVCSQLSLSPRNDYIAYVTDEYNKKKVWLYDLNKQKAKKIFRRGYQLDDKQDVSYPLLAWHPNGKILSLITEDQGGIWLRHYDVAEKKMNKQELFNFEKILDFSYSPDGSQLLFSAVQQGQSDIFIYFIASKTYEQVTKDIYDDSYPHFINKDKIVFSSNRISDTIVFDITTHKKDYSSLSKKMDYNDLFVYNYKSKSPYLQRVRNSTKADDIQAMPYDDKHIAYLSDENGIFNINLASFDSAVSYVDTITHYRYFAKSFPLTNYSRSIIEFDVNKKQESMIMLSYHNGEYKIIKQETPSISSLQNIERDKTSYAQLLETGESIIEEEEEDTPKEKEDFIKQKTIILGENPEKNAAYIDINNYAFVDETKENLIDEKGESQDKDSTGFILPKQRNYDVQYFINEVVNQIDFNYLNYSYQPFTGGQTPIYQNPGFNVMFKIGICDLMEDYRIVGGANLSVNLRNNEYFLSYSMLKGRWDKEVVFHRNVIENVQDDSYSKHQVHEAFYRLRYPFNPDLSLRGTAILRNDYASFMAINSEQLQKDDEITNWGGLKTELVFDNTRERGLNIYFGTRFKVFAEYYNKIENVKENLFVSGFDFRHYQKIHKNFIWANRLAGSTSFGNNELIYYLGGVDNWLFPKFNNRNSVDYSKNYAYQSLICNMRGFEQNVRHGNSFILLNSELRLPVFKYFSQKPVKSSFLDNFQIIAFSDFGSAFDGLNPLSEENSTFEEYIYNYPITVKVIQQKSSFVGGYGFGLRTKIMGYFLRADWAWGVEDNEIMPAIFYLSLNMDF
jgi:Tol biopolymer transport system component